MYIFKILKYFKLNINREKRPWKTDMEDVGILLAKLLAQSCNFELDKESRQSALGKFYNLLNISN